MERKNGGLRRHARDYMIETLCYDILTTREMVRAYLKI